MNFKPYTKQEVIDRIERVISGIESGELAHEQSELHCGTAHCIAGWLMAFDYRDDRGNKDFIHDADVVNGYCDVGCCWACYFRFRYDLPGKVVGELFAEDLTIEDIRCNFDAMKKEWQMD